MVRAAFRYGRYWSESFDAGTDCYGSPIIYLESHDCRLHRRRLPQWLRYYGRVMNLGNFSDMFFIVVLALIIFGPKRLPEMARQLGKALSEFKRASNEFKAQLETEMRQIEIEEALRKEKDALAKTITAPPGTLESAAENP